MTTAAVFISGNSQAARLPKQFHFHLRRVHVERRGYEIVLRELPLTMAEFIDKLPVTSDWPDACDEGIAETIRAW